MPVFKTIRQTAATGLITEHYLRQMVKRGECPGILSGSRFLVNVPVLAERLDELSKSALDGAIRNPIFAASNERHQTGV